MWSMKRNAAFALAVVSSLFAASARGQQTAIPSEPPQAPRGYLLIEEDQWNMLADEPGRHVDRARDAYLMMDAQVAAAELRKAAVYLRAAAGQASERTRRALARSEHDLLQMARQIEAGTFKSMEEFDVTTSRALHALANDQYVKATESWRKRELRRAGQYLRSSADNLEHAAARTDASMRQATAVVVKDTRLVSGKLIEGTGFVIDEVGSGFEAVGKAIERVGTRVEPLITR